MKPYCQHWIPSLWAPLLVLHVAPMNWANASERKRELASIMHDCAPALGTARLIFRVTQNEICSQEQDQNYLSARLKWFRPLQRQTLYLVDISYEVIWKCNLYFAERHSSVIPHLVHLHTAKQTKMATSSGTRRWWWYLGDEGLWGPARICMTVPKNVSTVYS